MLTSEHAIVEYSRSRAVPDCLSAGRHGHYLQYAQRMQEIYRRGSGLQRRQLHRQVRELLADEADCPLRRIEGLCKLLDERSVYQSDRRGQAAALRLKVFTLAGRLHPLVEEPDKLFEHGYAEAKAHIAKEVGLSWQEIDARLYADVMQFQKLESFEPFDDAQALLSRYNVAQLQACLYRARSMSVEAAGDFKTILRYAKLARLLHDITRLGPRKYRIELSGPSSALRAGRSYGVHFAMFLPAILACREWSLSAVIETPWNATARLELTDRSGFKSHLPAPEAFDSDVEEAFARKFGEHRDGWQLIREGEVLWSGQRVFVPDFVFRRQDGAQVLMEIVGFWTPEYLQSKRQTLREFRQHRILIAVPQRSVRENAVIGDDVIVYKAALKPQAVLDALNRCSVAQYSSFHG
ncbi:MAG: DUF790 family protein [Planctomycetaceae bacterium]|nr:DUF790 family protein [Planctomycetaceae bacterium]